jgi:uncharacterized protein YoxC
MNSLLVIFVAIAAVAIVVQLAVLLAIYLSVRRVAQDASRVALGIEEQVLPFFVDAQHLLKECAPKLKGSVDDIAVATAVIREKSTALGKTADDAIDRARLQLLHADHLATETLNRVESTIEGIRSMVETPKRHLNALLMGLAAGIGQYIVNRKGQ